MQQVETASISKDKDGACFCSDRKVAAVKIHPTQSLETSLMDRNLILCSVRPSSSPSPLPLPVSVLSNKMAVGDVLKVSERRKNSFLQIMHFSLRARSGTKPVVRMTEGNLCVYPALEAWRSLRRSGFWRACLRADPPTPLLHPCSRPPPRVSPSARQVLLPTAPQITKPTADSG